MAIQYAKRTFDLERHLRDAAAGDAEARHALGVVYSCGSFGIAIDLIEAHKWFNLAALAGSEEGQVSRAEISEEMTAREIAEAQRAARAWLRETGNAKPEASSLRLAA
ncbi:hypothetical protein [Sphingomonas fennica]|jgi:TPR repeat protein|uniref:Sel1 repeat family protein n=1 Tax=Edaphosphingomonas fennica TaxID=114404 RepID=A0A2T4HJD2_9SPHN|nr:hypothetical protein [Sphingomonas fennica]PTD15887.1 hypothetical protein CV103_21390 [Sphingomonas fennica]